MNNLKWIEQSVWMVIALNLLILVFMFFIPRAQFIIGHWGWTDEMRMESPGAKDTPNQYPNTYRIVNQIRRVVAEESIIFMPPDNWEFGSNRSVMIQRLYPRKVYFSGDKNFKENLKNADSAEAVYAVGFPNDSTNLCTGKKIQQLGVMGFIICEWNSSD